MDNRNTMRYVPIQNVSVIHMYMCAYKSLIITAMVLEYTRHTTYPYQIFLTIGDPLTQALLAIKCSAASSVSSPAKQQTSKGVKKLS